MAVKAYIPSMNARNLKLIVCKDKKTNIKKICYEISFMISVVSKC